MSSKLRAGNRFALLGLLLAFPLAGVAQNRFTPQEAEYAIAGTLREDQTQPQAAVNPAGGYLVWQDNVTDGDGLGISALRLNNSLSGELAPFRVNDQAAGDQENPQVARLTGGQTIFVWQGGVKGFQKVFTRFLGTNGTFTTGDVLVNTYTNNAQINPVVAGLADGTAVIVWSSAEQDGSMQGVFAQRFSATGQKLGDEFQVNQFKFFNQRTPAVAALSGGGFVVVWVSEQQRFENSVDIYARICAIGSDNKIYAQGNELRINSGNDVCANPSVAANAGGGFGVVWGQNFSRIQVSTSTQTQPGDYLGRVMLDGAAITNGWDVFSRTFDSQGSPASQDVRVNSCVYGDQYAPRISARQTDYLVVWTSMGQDRSWEGVYGQFLGATGGLVGGEFRVNTSTLNRQIQPAIASDGDTRFLVVWSSFAGGTASFDLFGQRYAAASAGQILTKPAPPLVSALSSSRLSVTWPPLDGYDVDHYELYLNDRTAPITLASNLCAITQLGAGSTNLLRLKYQLTDGRVSPLSDPATGITWGEDENMDGLPDDWQRQSWGPKSDNWPAPKTDSDGDGANNLQEFLAGTNPLDSHSVLRLQITAPGETESLSWTTVPGFIYQVQSATDFVTWSNLGIPRFARYTTDSILLNSTIKGTNGTTYYRVIRLR